MFRVKFGARSRFLEPRIRSIYFFRWRKTVYYPSLITSGNGRVLLKYRGSSYFPQEGDCDYARNPDSVESCVKLQRMSDVPSCGDLSVSKTFRCLCGEVHY